MNQERGLYRRGKVWWICYSVNGRTVRESTGDTNKELARRALAARRDAVAAGRFNVSAVKHKKPVSFEEMAAAHIEKHSRVNTRPGSAGRDVTSTIALKKFFGGRVVTRITTRDVEMYREQRLAGRFGKKITTRTVNIEVGCLRKMFNKLPVLFDGEVYDIEVKNPVLGVKFYPEDNSRCEFLTEEEISRLLAVCRNRSQAFHDIVFALLNTGCRCGELISLTWDRVNLKTRDIVITAKTTKGKRTRHIPISSPLFKVLAETKMKAAPGTRYVFLAVEGQPWKYYNLRNTWDRTLMASGIAEERRQAGKPWFRLHDLRHTFASHLAMTSHDLNLVRESLGHQSMDMTLRYSHLSRDYQQEKIERMAAVIFGNYCTITAQSGGKQ